MSRKKCCAIPIEMGFSWISSWIFMDFYMLVSQLFPKKNDGSFHVFRKSPSGWAAIFCISSSETADGNGWVEHVRETPPKSHGSEKNIHFSAYFHIYIYICALVNRPSQVPQLSKKTIEMLFFFHGRSPEIEPLDIFRHL